MKARRGYVMSDTDGAEVLFYDLESWFKYAEKIGQQRLYNFLMTESILLLAFAAVRGWDNRYLAIEESLLFLGLGVSILWFFQGTRQKKFHDVISMKLRAMLDNNEIDINKVAYKIIDDLKREHKRKKPSNHIKLNILEHLFSTRQLLWIIPLCFFAEYIYIFWCIW